MKTVLTIAGFDPSSGAGITADLMVFAAHGLFGTACITALTVQNTLGVLATHAVAADMITATLDHLYLDLPPAGIKIGMLGTAGAVHAVAGFLARIREIARVPVVLDPVLKSSSGRDLLDPEGVRALRSELLPLIDWITPNIGELAVLTGTSSLGQADLAGAASELQQSNRGLTVVVTGGDLEPPTDLLVQPASDEVLIRGERILSSATHGTGCVYSSALLSRLALGDDPLPAAEAAKHYVAERIRSAPRIGHGKGPLWPIERS